MKLVIGNKNYSTWSLRPWLLLSAFNIDFEEELESLQTEGRKARLGKHSPTSKVPVLIDNHMNIWDSLAICEYVSEKYLDGKGWPKRMDMRAEARVLCAEMHSGFTALRNELPMNCRATRKIELSSSAKENIARIDAIWSEYTQKYSHVGSWLFGKFSIADCFYAPVALRFLTYGVSLSAPAQKYATLLLEQKNVIQWVKAGKQELEVIEEDEAGE